MSEQFVIPENKQKLFDALMVILREVDRVCRKNDITYWANAGTLLGAVRHKGFIPWDDDIDLYMLRGEYERFREACKRDLQKNFFLQTTLDEEGYYRYPGRVRNSDTTYFTIREMEMMKAGRRISYNCGIFISIFPIDGTPKSSLGRKIQEKTSIFRNKLLISDIYSVQNHLSTKLIRAYASLVGYKNIYRRLERSFTKHKTEDTDLWEVPNFYPHVRTNLIPADCFRETVYLDFNDMKIPCPAGYDRLLSQNYGDYMSYPPGVTIDDRIHGMYIDFDHSYREYLSGERKIENMEEYMKR